MKRAIVTGASSGIGRRIAIELWSEGYEVWNLSRRPEPKDGDIPTHELVEGRFFQVDFSKPNNIKRFVDYAVANDLRFDVVVLNAGYMGLKEYYTWEELEDMFRVNAMSHYWFIQEMIRCGLLKENAVVVVTSSIAGVIGIPDDVPYGMAKASLINMVKSLAIKYAGKYRFVAISPGLTRTWLVGNPDETPEFLIERMPIGRMIEPSEVAKLVMAVIENEAITGANFIIDGGEHLKGL